MQLPARISKYELLEFLGGGMAHVYRARDTVIDRVVAVKILTEQGCADPDSKARFLQEARLAGGFSHDNIIRIHDYGEEDGRPFIVMEFLVGEDLRNAIRNGHTGDLAKKLDIALQIARALEFVHSKKIVHRDIKPENIHIDPAGRVRLMDFGIAKSQEFSLTKTGLALGTPYYMAPEQILGQAPTEQVDIYAYGVLLYEMMTGQKPMVGDTVERLFYMILHEPLQLDPLIAAGLPEGVIDLITRCTAKKREDRIQAFGEVQQRLDALLGQERAIPAPLAAAAVASGAPQEALIPAPASGHAVAEPATVPEPGRRKSWLWAITAMVLIGVVVAGGWFWLRLRGTARETAAPQLQAPAISQKPLPEILNTPAGEMRLVPGGAFLFGEKKESATLPAFYMDRTEVSNAAYGRFCNEKNRPLPPHFRQDRPNDPVVNITIVDAQEFAKWAGKRLPTAQEWEKAARGTDGRTFPWGNEPDPLRANVKDNATSKGIAPAESYSGAASPFQLVNMAGNVWEFVDELKSPSPEAVKNFAALLRPPPAATEPWYLIKGGAFDRPLSFAVTYEWISVPARFTAPDIGFRCVKNP